MSAQPTPEELQLLAFLDHLKDNDPELYKQTMTSMQSELAQGANPDLPNILSQLKASSSGTGANADIVNGFNMPGMAKILGKVGVEDKVGVLLFSC